jgi:ABC-type transport system substrate-binding protein
MGRKRKAIFPLVLIAALCLIGCSQGKGRVPGKRDNINLTLAGEVTSLDPFYTTALIDYQLAAQTYEGLYFIDDDLSLSPRLAESYTLAPDGKTYTFTLRKGVTFHNGEPLTPADVKFSLERAIAAPAKMSNLAFIDSVSIVGDDTVQVKTKQIMAAALNFIVSVEIMNKKAVEEAGATFGTKPVDCGTGPYRVTSYEPSSKVELEAYPKYYRAAAPIKHVTYRIMRDTSTALVAFESGEIDFVQVPLSNLNAIQGSGKYETALSGTTHISYLAINHRKAPFDNKKLRQAIAYAMDKKSMVVGAYEGYATVADYMMNPAYVNAAPKKGKIYSYDAEKAKALLAEAGYPHGLDVGVMLTIGSGYWPKLAQIIQQNLADIGITCSIQPMDTSAVIKNQQKGNYGFGLMGLTPDRDYSYFSRSCHSRSMAIAAVKFNDPYIDKMFDKGAVELDPVRRQAIYDDVNDYMQELCCLVPIFYKSYPYAWNKNLNAKINLNYYYVYNFSWK